MFRLKLLWPLFKGFTFHIVLIGNLNGSTAQHRKLLIASFLIVIAITIIISWSTPYINYTWFGGMKRFLQNAVSDCFIRRSRKKVLCKSFQKFYPRFIIYNNFFIWFHGRNFAWNLSSICFPLNSMRDLISQHHRISLVMFSRS